MKIPLIYFLSGLLLFTACKKEDRQTPKVSIQIENPSETMSALLPADQPVLIKATVTSNITLKRYTIVIRSTADSKELLRKSEEATGKTISIAVPWSYYSDADLAAELQISVEESGGAVFTEKRLFTRAGIAGYDKNLGLGVSMTHFRENPVNKIDKIETEFVLTNYGDKSYKKNDILYINSRLNNNYFDLKLFPGRTTVLQLTKDLNKGDTLKYNPGYIFGSQTLNFPFPGIQGASQLEVCIVVWGSTPESVQQNNPSATKCISCGTYKP